MRRGQAVRMFRSSVCRKLLFLLGIGLWAVPGLPAVTQNFSISAANVSVPGQGSAEEHFTLTSVGGFTGTVNVECRGPSPLGDLVLPECGPAASAVVPANGSVGGTVSFVPPWTNGAASRSTVIRPSTLPMMAGALAGLGLLGLRLRRGAHRILSLTIVAVCVAALAAIAGCLGGSGLAMTPGTYEYTLTATSTSLTQTATIDVTVQCNSCP